MPILALVFAALVLALVEQLQDEGKSIHGWALILVCVYLISLATRWP